MPKRIQFQRKKGFRLPENCVRVSRPSRWGNPYKIGDKKEYRTASGAVLVDRLMTRDEVLREFENCLQDNLRRDNTILEPLRGKDLACFCRLQDDCHADILLKYANAD